MLECRRDSVRWYNWFTPPAKWIKQNAPIIHRKIQSHPFAFKETTKQWSRCWICLLLMKIIAFSIVSTLKERCDFFCFCELAGLFSSSITAQNLSIERGPEGNWVWLPPHALPLRGPAPGVDSHQGFVLQCKPLKTIPKSLTQSFKCTCQSIT